MEDTTTPRTLAKHNKYRKPRYTQQDVRQKSIEARDELLANVDFLVEVIREDRYHLKRYKDKFGDLRYRPIVTPEDKEHSIEATYGHPTDLALEPLASKYRATIKSLLDSIKLINSEILTEEAQEGESTDAPDTDSTDSPAPIPRNQSLREGFKAMSKDSRAFQAPIPKADPEDPNHDPHTKREAILAESKERTKELDYLAERDARIRANQADPAWRAWRSTVPGRPTPRLVPRTNPDVEEEPKNQVSSKSKLEEAMEESQPKGLSPMMRARLFGMGKVGPKEDEEE